MFPNPSQCGQFSAKQGDRYGSRRFGKWLHGKRGGNPRIYITAHKAAHYRRRLIALGFLPPGAKLNGDQGWRNWNGSDAHLRTWWTAPGSYAIED